MKLLKRHRCSCCDKMAQYKSVDTRYRNFYYCRDCKPSQGEFVLERNGFPIYEQETFYVITKEDIAKALGKSSIRLLGNIFYEIKDMADDAYFMNVTSKGYISYNKFMSSFGEDILLQICTKEYGRNTKAVYKFYENFKRELRACKKNVKSL